MLHHAGWGYLLSMSPFSKLALIPVSQSSKIAERLLAHARLCRQIADASLNEETAEKLAQLADKCTRAAAGATTTANATGQAH
jgi:hypothetical protein